MDCLPVNAIKWKICCFFKPNLKLLDDEYIIFDKTSGDTFRVPYLEGYIIEKLLVLPATEEDLFKFIDITDDCVKGDLRRALSRALHELNVASMVEIFQE